MEYGLSKHLRLIILAVLFPITSYSSQIYFSSFTKGLYEVAGLTGNSEYEDIDILLPEDFLNKLNKKSKKFGNDLCLTIDGVRASVQSKTQKSGHLSVRARVPRNLFETSTLASIRKGQKVSIGLQSLNPGRFLLQENLSGKAKLVETKIVPNRMDTHELVFVAPLSQRQFLKDKRWVGINGSGFFIQDYKETADQIVFKVYAWKKTRERTVFGSAKLGEEFNITPQVKEPELQPKF